MQLKVLRHWLIPSHSIEDGFSRWIIQEIKVGDIVTCEGHMELFTLKHVEVVSVVRDCVMLHEPSLIVGETCLIKEERVLVIEALRKDARVCVL